MLRPLVIWIIGLPNAGKTTVAQDLQRRLKRQSRASIILDGDDMRTVLQMEESHFERCCRIDNALRIGRLARLLSSQGIIVIVAANTLLKEAQRQHREQIPGYFEIYLDADESTRRKRDQGKRLYERYDNKEISHVLGLDMEADVPQAPDLTIDSSYGKSSACQAARQIVQTLHERNLMTADAAPTRRHAPVQAGS